LLLRKARVPLSLSGNSEESVVEDNQDIYYGKRETESKAMRECTISYDYLLGDPASSIAEPQVHNR
jgi:hypothetical protein